MSRRAHRRAWRNRPSHEATAPLAAHHRDLLRACLATDDGLEAAMTTVRSRGSVDELDQPSRELLPFLYRRIVDLDLDLPERTTLASHYRRTWHRSQILLHRARPLFERITAVTGRVVVLKGGAMISSAYHDDLGVRPIMDLDVLVEPDHVEELVDWSLANGWTVTKGIDVRDIYTVHHAIDLEQGTDGAVDLHWALLVQGRDPDHDRELVARAIPARLSDLDVHVLPPTDQLFHTAAHAKPEGLRHVVDLVSIVRRHGSTIDWRAFESAVLDRRTITYTMIACDLVEQVAPGTLPDETVQRLADTPRHWSDYAFHGETLDRRRDIVRRLGADIAGRTRGAGPRARVHVALAMARRYRDASGLRTRDLWAGFVRRGGRGLPHGDGAPD